MDTAVGAALEREHREIDAGLAGFSAGLAEGEWRVEALHGAAAALRRHIFVEEELLFPALREAGLFGPVAVMLREHGEIWQALEGLEARARERSGPDETREVYRELAALLEAHNLKEEQILYPAADRVAPEQVTGEVLRYLEDGTLPEGWVCRALA